MYEQLVWQDRFNIGVNIIDMEHKKLFGIINRIFTSINQDSNSEWACQEGIKYFKNHAIKHFSDEEEYMQSINYSGYEMHKRIHDNFREKTLPALEKELEQKNFSEESVEHFMGVCVGWLLGHTMIEDHAITGAKVSNWSDLLSKEESAAISQSLIELLYDVFQLDASVISEHYGGEKFGKGIYYQLSYDSKKGEHWEVFLIFEEKMILSTIASIMGFRYDSINPTVINTSRYMSQQFLENLRNRFPTVGLCELKQENLLQHKQFQKIFKKENPRCSLLFSTSAGYFAFCVTSAQPAKDEGKYSIKTENENTMDEIKQYLTNRVVNRKNKILVVDDSITMRHFLKELLAKDYDVEMVDSGLSAFRSIILRRPDLVILDYDMPICDGKQVLEMIRGENDFKDIPVIFLTGRGDVESIRQVMSLTPEGYILKTTKPEEIKKSIEIFFKKKAK